MPADSTKATTVGSQTLLKARITTNTKQKRKENCQQIVDLRAKENHLRAATAICHCLPAK